MKFAIDHSINMEQNNINNGISSGIDCSNVTTHGSSLPDNELTSESGQTNNKGGDQTPPPKQLKRHESKYLSLPPLLQATHETIKEAEKEGFKSGMKGLLKKVGKAAGNELIDEMPGPPGHLARIIRDESRKAAERQRAKEQSRQIQNIISGKGDYKMRGSSKRSSRRSKSGVTLGNKTGSDFKVHANSISMGSMVSGVDIVPSFKGTLRETRVRHREYLGDVISSSTSGAFSINSYALNPGNVLAFPWLSVIAQNFDQWKPNGVVICFKSTSSTYNGSSQALGTVIIASDYDLTDSTYSSKIEMENSEFAVSAKSSDNILHPIECNINERQVKTLKCRGITTPSDNLQWYDLCNFQVATQGITGTSVNLGELWITYDITFLKEQLYGNLFGNSLLQMDYGSSSGITTSAYFGNNGTVDTSSTLVCTLGTSTITFPSVLSAGSYQILYIVGGSSTAWSTPTVAFTTNCTAGPAAISSLATVGSTQTGTTMIFPFTVTLTGPSAVITFSAGTLPTSANFCAVQIVQLNSSVY